MKDEDLMIFMELIAHSGNGKSEAFEAIQLAKKGDIAGANEHMEMASQSLLEAHHVQTKMLTEEAKGNHTLITLLTVHSQDHLMTAMTYMDTAKELIDIFERLNNIEKLGGK